MINIRNLCGVICYHVDRHLAVALESSSVPVEERLNGYYHAGISDGEKDGILKSFTDSNGTYLYDYDRNTVIGIFYFLLLVICFFLLWITHYSRLN